MPRRWTAAEFDQVYDNPHLSSQELSRTLLKRSSRAIDKVRAGINEYLSGRNHGFVRPELRQAFAERTSI